MDLNFNGKTAIVTGGASGIGRAVAEALRTSGATVHIIDLQGDPSVDISDADAVRRAFERLPEPDVVVANAGIGSPAELGATSDAHWQRTLDINLGGAFYTVRSAAERMKPRRQGAIVLTASPNSYDGEPFLTAYNASKAGVLGILHTAAGELGPYGIRVNAVCPGLIRTPLTEAHFSNPSLLKEYFRHIPLGRGGEAEEVAKAILFLASDAASFITGAALVVDGGQMASKFGTWSEEIADFGPDRWRLR